LYRRASAWSLTAVDFVVDDLPGIGRRYQMMGINGGRITVVVHHSGRRVVYGLDAASDQASAVELSDHQARKLGAILGGAFFKPAVVEAVEAVFDDLLIDGWPSSPTRLALTSPSPSWRYVVQPGVTSLRSSAALRRSLLPSRQRSCLLATAWSSSAGPRT
jgi:hypothetical protein